MVYGILTIVDIDHHSWLLGGFKPWNFIFSISLQWDVIRNPLTNSNIFQDGYCTTNQYSLFFGPKWGDIDV